MACRIGQWRIAAALAVAVCGTSGVQALEWAAWNDNAELVEEEAAGSLRLRGGIDANPRLLPDGVSSAFAGIEGEFAIGRRVGEWLFGITGEAEHTEYARRGFSPSENYRLGLNVENNAFDGWSLRANTNIENERHATIHAFDATQRLRAQWIGGPVRPFVTAELGYHSLNETNAILVDFLPEPQRFGRVNITPGVTLKRGGLEVGASLGVSATRYAERCDVFGFRRDNERIQPFVFARYEEPGLEFAASVSQLYARWHDVDFSRVNETLFDVSLMRTQDPFTLELAAARYAAETTFPISPITINESFLARLSYEPNPRWSFGAVGRGLRTIYLDSPFTTRLFAYGLTASYALSKDWRIGAEFLRINATAINGEPADGGMATLSLSRNIAMGTERKRRMPEPAPVVARWSPRSLTR